MELDVTLQRLVEAAIDLAQPRYAALGVLGRHGGITRFIHVGLDPATRTRMSHLPEGKGLLGQLIADPRPLRLADLSTHEASVGFPPNHPPMHNFLGVPVRVRDAMFGNLYLTEKADGAELPTPTRSSSRRSPPRRASRCRMPTCRASARSKSVDLPSGGVLAACCLWGSGSAAPPPSTPTLS